VASTERERTERIKAKSAMPLNELEWPLALPQAGILIWFRPGADTGPVLFVANKLHLVSVRS
jgi:hypothetical protein